MIRYIILLFFFIASYTVQAQFTAKEFREKKIQVTKDTILLDTISIAPEKFKVFANKKIVDTTKYKVNFAKATLILSKKKYPNITVQYYHYPQFITKVYTKFNKNLIVANTKSTQKLYSLTTNKNKEKTKLFENLKTSGFIVRGLTSGNNQNAVTNSSLDLTIEGKLSNKVSIKGNIFDTNIPLQQNGYSQNITDFDRIFVELYSNSWRVKGGDVSLKNKDTRFLNFEKQVAGLEVEAKLNKNISATASGAVVQGRFTSYSFVGVEANQGPYKLFGPNNEPVIIIVAGSEKVFVNGKLVQKGQNKDYIINYNLGEIIFNTNYPITQDMRIRVEFQYSDKNYTRFISYEKANFKNDNFSIAGYFYHENDLKNQPIQQNLGEAQKEILANAGNDVSKMITSSAVPDVFNPNKIQYKKTINTTTIFEYTTNEEDEVYTVIFTNVGIGKGNYAVAKNTAIGTIYEYVGENMGSFNPVTQLIAPTKLQIIAVNTKYTPTKKTTINTELAFSNYDKNLFSTIDDATNKKVAGALAWKQQLINAKVQLQSAINYTFVQNNFTTVQRFRSVEFSRDWNLMNPTGNQQELEAELILQDKKNNFASYGINYLNFSKNFTGIKHKIQAKLKRKKSLLSTKASVLENNGSLEKGNFLQLESNFIQSLGKPWLGFKFLTENNKRITKQTNTIASNSHKFKEYESYFGIGDTTKVYAILGVNYRENDSVRNTAFTQVNNRKTVYVKSKIVQNKTTNLSLFTNYRFTKNAFLENQKALNAKVVYNHRFFKNFLQLSSVYETSSAAIAQQDFIYVKTEPGQGYFTWIDYNQDGIEDFNEFEIAQFQDQANYLRIAKPNLRFVPTQKVVFQQKIAINPIQWSVKKGIQKIASHFYNQTYLNITNEQKRVGDSFNFNPFNFKEENILGLNYTIKNSLFFNKDLHKYSFTYSYATTQNKQQFSIGKQEANTSTSQIDFSNKLSKFWLFELQLLQGKNTLETENFSNRNYTINTKEILPKFTFLYTQNNKFSLFYNFKEKKNSLGDLENLQLHNLGVSYFYSNPKGNQITASVNAFLNNFTGNQNSPVGYQMLEGLQKGENYTWNLLLQQKLNSFLNLGLNYNGRKGENTIAIHTGSIQLKAIF